MLSKTKLQDIKHNGKLVGDTGDSKYGSGFVDAGFVCFDNQKDWQITPKANIQNTLIEYNNVHLGNDTMIVPGAPVLMLGSVTGRTTGFIEEIDRTFMDEEDLIPVYHCFTFSNFCQSGDSGAPVYLYGLDDLYLIGMLDGAFYQRPDNVFINSVACRISNVISALDVTIITKDNYDDFKDFTYELYSNGIAITSISAISTSVIIPKSINNKPVIGIDEEAASDNDVLETINLNDVEIVSKRAFKNCTKLKTVIAPKVTSIGSGAFDGCINLENFNLGNNLEKIYSAVFRDCKKLTSFNLVNVIEIPEEAFRGSGLTSLSIPASVSFIGSSAFLDCYSLAEIVVNSANQYYSSQDGILYNKGKTLFIHIPKALNGSVSISNEIIEIPNSAFANCTNLLTCTIPMGVAIGSNAFHNNTFVIWQGNFEFKAGILTKFIGNNQIYTIPNFITSIGNSAFANSLCNEVVLPSSVISIGENAFQNCLNLTNINIPKKVTTMGANVFLNCNAGLVIDADHIPTPSGWSSSWNPDNRTVMWQKQYVTFDLNGGTGNFPTLTINYGLKVSKPSANPYPPAFKIFRFWAESTDLTREYEWNTPVTSTVTLYAIWAWTDGNPGVVVWDGSIASTFSGGNGSQSAPFRISTGAELARMAAEINSGRGVSSWYFLANNINLNNTANWEIWKNYATAAAAWNSGGIRAWNPIATNPNMAFKGNFDGRGFVIKGLYNNNNITYLGLFGCIGVGGVVRNLGIGESYIRGSNYVGSIAGWISGGSIVNCYNGGSIDSSSSSGYAGGIVGYVNFDTVQYRTSIINNYNKGSVGMYPNRSGGIAGYVFGLHTFEYNYFLKTTTINANLFASSNDTGSNNSRSFNSSGVLMNEAGTSPQPIAPSFSASNLLSALNSAVSLVQTLTNSQVKSWIDTPFPRHIV